MIQLIKWKWAGISFLFFVFMFWFINFAPMTMPELLKITNGETILDLHQKGYSPDEAYGVLERFGEAGRNYNLKVIIPVDFIFPLSYGLFYFIMLTLLFKPLLAGKSWLIGLVGVLACFTDWVENIFIMFLLLNYPQRLDGVASMASNLTLAKGMLIMLSMLLVLVGLVLLGVRKIRGK
jgi:hypothetical protein